MSVRKIKSFRDTSNKSTTEEGAKKLYQQYLDRLENPENSKKKPEDFYEKPKEDSEKEKGEKSEQDKVVEETVQALKNIGTTPTETTMTEEKGKSFVKKFFNKAKNVSKGMAKVIKNAPLSTKQFITDTEFRKKAIKKSASVLRDNASYIAKTIVASTKSEAVDFARPFTAPVTILSRLKNGERPLLSENEKFSLYSGSVYWGCIIGSFSMSHMSGYDGVTALDAMKEIGDAFMHSFTIHAALGAVAKWLKDLFKKKPPSKEQVKKAIDSGAIKVDDVKKALEKELEKAESEISDEEAESYLEQLGEMNDDPNKLFLFVEQIENTNLFLQIFGAAGFIPSNFAISTGALYAYSPWAFGKEIFSKGADIITKLGKEDEPTVKEFENFIKLYADQMESTTDDDMLYLATLDSKPYENIHKELNDGVEKAKKEEKKKNTKKALQVKMARSVAIEYLSRQGAYKDKKKVVNQDGKESTIYIYSDEQIRKRNKEKSKKIEKLRKCVSDLRSKYRRDMDSEDERKSITSLAVSLIDLTYERVGNPKSAEDGHFGITGLQKRHLKFSKGTAVFTYVGKSGVKQTKEVTDEKVVSKLKEITKKKSKEDNIFTYGEDGKCVSARLVNAYLKDFGISAKDIRGFHANEEMKKALKAIRKENGKLSSDEKEKARQLKDEFSTALKQVAKIVGHQHSTLKNQYLVSHLEEKFLESGKVITSLKTATKSQSEKEDEQVENIHKKNPKERPPRYDLRKRIIEDEDPDLDTQDKDLSLKHEDYKRASLSDRVAELWLLAKDNRVLVFNRETEKVTKVKPTTLQTKSNIYEPYDSEKHPPVSYPKDRDENFDEDDEETEDNEIEEESEDVWEDNSPEEMIDWDELINWDSEEDIVSEDEDLYLLSEEELISEDDEITEEQTDVVEQNTNNEEQSENENTTDPKKEEKKEEKSENPKEEKEEDPFEKQKNKYKSSPSFSSQLSELQNSSLDDAVKKEILEELTTAFDQYNNRTRSEIIPSKDISKIVENYDPTKAGLSDKQVKEAYKNKMIVESFLTNPDNVGDDSKGSEEIGEQVFVQICQYNENLKTKLQENIENKLSGLDKGSDEYAKLKAKKDALGVERVMVGSKGSKVIGLLLGGLQAQHLKDLSKAEELKERFSTISKYLNADSDKKQEDMVRKIVRSSSFDEIEEKFKGNKVFEGWADALSNTYDPEFAGWAKEFLANQAALFGSKEEYQQALKDFNSQEKERKKKEKEDKRNLDEKDRLTPDEDFQIGLNTFLQALIGEIDVPKADQICRINYLSDLAKKNNNKVTPEIRESLKENFAQQFETDGSIESQERQALEEKIALSSLEYDNGEHWPIENGYGAKNSKGYIRYFEKETDAKQFKVSSLNFQSFIYNSMNIDSGLSIITNSTHSNRRDNIMSKINKQSALKVSGQLDRIANLFEKSFTALGVPEKIAKDFAYRCDLLSDNIEQYYGVNKQALDDLDPVLEPGFNPDDIGREQGGAIEEQGEHAWMSGEFSRQEHRELRDLQESGDMSNVQEDPRQPNPGRQASDLDSAINRLSKKADMSLLSKCSELRDQLKICCIKMKESGVSSVSSLANACDKLVSALDKIKEECIKAEAVGDEDTFALDDACEKACSAVEEILPFVSRLCLSLGQLDADSPVAQYQVEEMLEQSSAKLEKLVGLAVKIVADALSDISEKEEE